MLFISQALSCTCYKFLSLKTKKKQGKPCEAERAGKKQNNLINLPPQGGI
jgi:hypothetical protein